MLVALLVASPVLTLGALVRVAGETARIIFNEAEPWAEGVSGTARGGGGEGRKRGGRGGWCGWYGWCGWLVWLAWLHRG